MWPQEYDVHVPRQDFTPNDFKFGTLEIMSPAPANPAHDRQRCATQTLLSTSSLAEILLRTQQDCCEMDIELFLDLPLSSPFPPHHSPCHESATLAQVIHLGARNIEKGSFAQI